MPRARMRSISQPTTSPSRNPSTEGLESITVTFVPSAAKRQAYSQPITPPPTTAMLEGSACTRTISSES